MTYPFLSAVKQDSQAVDDLIRANLNSEVPMVEEIAAYMVSLIDQETGDANNKPKLFLTKQVWRNSVRPG